MKKSTRNNILFLIAIALLIIPQTRKPIQVLLHKGLSLFASANPVDKAERKSLSDYNWKLVNERGETVNFSSVKEKVVVINFWATWCPPCIAEMPSLQKLYDKYKNEVEFLFVTSDSKKIVKGFKTNKNYTFPVFQQLSVAPEILQTRSIPRTLIINKQGEIIIDKSGAVDWFGENIQKEINKLVSE